MTDQTPSVPGFIETIPTPRTTEHMCFVHEVYPSFVDPKDDRRWSWHAETVSSLAEAYATTLRIRDVHWVGMVPDDFEVYTRFCASVGRIKMKGTVLSCSFVFGTEVKPFQPGLTNARDIERYLTPKPYGGRTPSLHRPAGKQYGFLTSWYQNVSYVYFSYAGHGWYPVDGGEVPQKNVFKSPTDYPAYRAVVDPVSGDVYAVSGAGGAPARTENLPNILSMKKAGQHYVALDF